MECAICEHERDVEPVIDCFGLIRGYMCDECNDDALVEMERRRDNGE